MSPPFPTRRSSELAGKANGFAIFTGNSGQVLIDNSAGAVKTGGLQFAIGGYVLSGGTLTLAGGDRTVIRVGAGSVWDSSLTAEIAAPLSGDRKSQRLNSSH